jgi:hypothetical protein
MKKVLKLAKQLAIVPIIVTILYYSVNEIKAQIIPDVLGLPCSSGVFNVGIGRMFDIGPRVGISIPGGGGRGQDLVCELNFSFELFTGGGSPTGFFLGYHIVGITTDPPTQITQSCTTADIEGPHASRALPGTTVHTFLNKIKILEAV